MNSRQRTAIQFLDQSFRPAQSPPGPKLPGGCEPNRSAGIPAGDDCATGCSSRTVQKTIANEISRCRLFRWAFGSQRSLQLPTRDYRVRDLILSRIGRGSKGGRLALLNRVRRPSWSEDQPSALRRACVAVIVLGGRAETACASSGPNHNQRVL